MDRTNTPSDLVIYCTRPGARMWKASISDGRVLNTLQYKEMLSASFKMEPDLSQSESRQRSSGSISANAQSIKEKSIAHNFSLVYSKTIKCPADHLPNILLTYNSVGIYLISIGDMSNINFLRLAKKGGSISNVVVDSNFENDCDENEETIRKINKENGENVSTTLHLNEIKPFPVYVTNCNGFVERHIIQPRILPKEDSSYEMPRKEPDKMSRNIDSTSNVSTAFAIFIIYKIFYLYHSYNVGVSCLNSIKRIMLILFIETIVPMCNGLWFTY